MSELMRRDSSRSPEPFGGVVLNRNGRREVAKISGNAAVTRHGDMEAARTTANRMDATAAVAAHAMERAVDIIQYRRDLAQGDPDVDLELMQFQRTAFRQMTGLQQRLYGPLG